MRSYIIALLCGSCCIAAGAAALAQTPSADEKAFLDKHMSEVVSTSAKRLDQPAVAKVFAVPIYQITITVNSGDDGSGTQQQLAARVDDKLVPLSRPGTDQDCPSIQKMIRGDIKLKTDADAKTLQDALDVVFAPVMNDEKKAIAFRHAGNEWTFIRGPFMDKKMMGFVISTDDKGTITAVKYSLQLTP